MEEAARGEVEGRLERGQRVEEEDGRAALRNTGADQRGKRE